MCFNFILILTVCNFKKYAGLRSLHKLPLFKSKLYELSCANCESILRVTFNHDPTHTQVSMNTLLLKSSWLEKSSTADSSEWFSKRFKQCFSSEPSTEIDESFIASDLVLRSWEAVPNVQA